MLLSYSDVDFVSDMKRINNGTVDINFYNWFLILYIHIYVYIYMYMKYKREKKIISLILFISQSI